jgi:hypothetical protein
MPEHYICDVVGDKPCVYKKGYLKLTTNFPDCEGCLYRENLILRHKIKELKTQGRGNQKRRQSL